MTITVQREELAPLHDAWATLAERAEEPIPFVHPTWARVWLEEFQDGRELVLLSARDGDELVGVAPLLRTDATLEFVGNYKMCDYMDFVLAPGRERDVLAAFFAALAEDPCSELDLRGLRENSKTLDALSEAAQAAGFACEREDEAVAPKIDVAPSWDEHLSSLSKKNRHELRRKLRRLQAAGEVELQVYQSPDDIEAHLPVLLRLMVESRRDKADFMSEQMGRFFHRMATSLAGEGLLRLYELELDTKAVAAVLCFDQGKRLYMYNSGYDPDYSGLAVGIGSKALCLHEAMEAGYTSMDFLRGHESYKYDLGGEDRQIYRCLLKRA